MELKGTIKKIGEVQTFASGFQKREFVLLTNEQYPQPINIELLSDKVDIINPFNIGDEAEVGINIRGREWTSPQGETKYFNSINAWKITNPNPIDTSGKVIPGNATDAFGFNENPFASDSDDHELPF